MLEIDYSLVSMSEADEQLVQVEVERRIAAGEIPPPDRSVNGRLVLLNPDPVQTIHQVPDELRPRLRRIMMPAQEGSTHLPASRLFANTIDSDERLYLIVIELNSDFRSFSSFLDYIPRLRAEYPELAIYLSGTLPDLRAKLAQVLEQGGATLLLDYGGEQPVEVQNAEAFTSMVSTRAQVISYAAPFFTEVRLLLRQGSKAIPFNLLSLRKLHSVFGHGAAEQVEVGKGRKERMIVVDLPVALIQDFRFRQDRGLDFLGVTINGETIQSRYFGDERLEFRWVPMRSVEEFLRRTPSGGTETVDMREVDRLRVNTLTGEVSFIVKDASQQVAVEQAKRIGFRKLPTAATRKAPGAEIGEAEQVIEFDRYLEPSSHSAVHDPMQDAVRAHFYHKLIGETVEHGRKQELYAQAMRVAAVGPLAGQTLKLLRRFGLERLIDPESFYYLADTTEEVPYYRNTPARYEEHFQGLVAVIREVAVGQPSDAVRIADIAYNMPISTEWVDAGLASLEGVSNQELEAVYGEMRLLSDFIAHEFKRNFDIRQEDLTFFSKIRTCHDAGLLAKWLSEYKRGAYGQPIPEDARPDVLFFATDADKQENDTRYYFPSLSGTELVRTPTNKALFEMVNYDFTVFLEEQMALAAHVAREEGVMEPGLPEFTSYFSTKIAEGQGQVAELREMLAAIDDENSPIYKQMLEQEEKAYHERYQQFVQDRARVDKELVEIAGRVDELVGELQGQLDRGEATQAEFLKDTPGHPELLEQRILGAAMRTRNHLKEQLQAAFEKLLGEIDAWREQQAAFVLALRRFLHHHQGWQTAVEVRQSADLREQWEGQIPGRMEQLRRMKALDREQHGRRVQTQLRNYQGELTQLNAGLHEQLQKNQRAGATLNAYVQSAGGRLGSLRETVPDAEPEKVLRQAQGLHKLLGNIASNAGGLAERVQAMEEELEKAQVRRQRFAQQLYQLRAEHALIRAVEERSEPVLPKVQAPGGKVPAPEDVARMQKVWQGQAAAMRRARGDLGAGAEGVAASLQALRGTAVELKRFGGKHDQLIKLIARKARLRDSAKSLAERQTIMDDELQDLPARVREQFMPARKQLLVEVFLPETGDRIEKFEQAQALVSDIISLPEEPLKNLYLDRAIFRRFYGRQFQRGGAYASDADHPMHFPTRNVAPALRLLLRGLTHNYKRHRYPGANQVQLPQLSSQSPQQILATIENLASVPGRGQFDYLVLPPTLSLTEGLRVIHRKEELYEGLPRLVLIFVTKFDPHLLRSDAELRDSYFRALKHNIVLNIDGHAVVDNPRSIGMRLLSETLGCAVDIPEVEEPPEAASAAE